eukprot:TRINITY_DN27232_c0_g1_i1.p1 TRINITY_DN27232_c0_g1~~TRINITY_DN27232_c0_g1_i1.p1  ORF type:complete len:187 (+),score=51.79 TRINITY_DN27232_c0_g1_i1:44-604(+)
MAAEAADGAAAPPLINDKTISLLSQGFQESFSATQDTIQTQLAEVSTAQKELLALVESHAEPLCSNRSLKEVEEILSKVPAYTAKLTQVRKDMLALHERSSKLKKRALKAKDAHDQKLQNESKAREKQQAKEDALIAQPADAIIKADEARRRKSKSKDGSTRKAAAAAGSHDVEADAEVSASAEPS